MTTYVICDNCGERFQSPIQVENLESNVISGNRTICPHFNQEPLIENRNLVNE